MTLRHLQPIPILLMAAVAAGCTALQPDVAWPDRRPLGSDILLFVPPRGADSAAAPSESAGPLEGKLTLRAALEAALLRNPTLAAASWNRRIGEAQVLRAGLLPNPELEIEVEDVAGTGGGNAGVEAAETTIALGQLVELGGKRAARIKLATIEGQLAGWDYEAERLAVLTGTALAFVDVLAAQEQLRLAEDLRTLSEQTYETVAERVKAGKVSPLEKTKAAVELANSKIKLAKAQSRLRSARTRLAATWGDVAPRFAEAVGALESIAEPPPLKALQALVHRNPEIARWAQEMQQRLAALAVEKAARVPDLTVGFGVKRSEENDDYALVLGVGVPLHVFDRNQGGIREARYRLAQMQHEKRGAEVRTARALTESYEVLQIARAEALSLKSDVVPAAVQAFDAAREGYQLGRFGYLDVLDAQRTLFESRAGLLDALARYHRAVAVVESLIGTRLHSLNDDKQAKKED